MEKFAQTDSQAVASLSRDFVNRYGRCVLPNGFHLFVTLFCILLVKGIITRDELDDIFDVNNQIEQTPKLTMKEKLAKFFGFHKK